MKHLDATEAFLLDVSHVEADFLPLFANVSRLCDHGAAIRGGGGHRVNGTVRGSQEAKAIRSHLRSVLEKASPPLIIKPVVLILLLVIVVIEAGGSLSPLTRYEQFPASVLAPQRVCPDLSFLIDVNVNINVNFILEQRACVLLLFEEVPVPVSMILIYIFKGSDLSQGYRSATPHTCL